MKKPLVLPVLIVMAAGLSGCLTPAPGPASRFYQLQPAVADQPDGKASVGGPVVQVGPVKVADYLNRAQMVTRVGEHQVAYDELQRWAEPLNQNITWVLTRDLSTRIPEARIIPFSAMPMLTHVSFTVPVQIARLEALPDGTVLMDVAWMVIPRKEPDRAVPRRMTRTLTAASDSAEDLVAAQSQLIQGLCESISEDLREEMD